MTAHEYLARRLDGARDLYLLALALGARGDGPPPHGFGRLIQEARIHFVSVIEEARIAGLDIHDIQQILATESAAVTTAVRPEIRNRVEELLRSRPPR